MIEHSQFYFGALMISLAALVAWAIWMLPQWSQPGICFGVTVNPDFRGTPEARRLLRSYRLKAMIHVAISFALILAGVLPKYWPLLIIGVIWLGVGPLATFVEAHQAVLPHAVAAVTVREAVLERRDTRLSGGWIVQLGPFAILLATGIYLNLHWGEIPERFPVHWGVNGQPNGWSTHTPMGVYFPLILGAVISAGISLMANALPRSTRLVRATGSGSIVQDFARRVGLFLLLVEYFLALVFSCVGLLPLTGAAPVSIVTILMLPSLVIFIIWLNKGRSYTRSAGAMPTSVTAGDGTPDKYWKLGVIYFNPDDAALFVEKRAGIGYTMNFGRVSAWIIMALVLVLPLTLGLLALRHR